MNRIYKLVWNFSLQLWQVTSELASQKRGGSSSGTVTAGPSLRKTTLAAALALGMMGVMPQSMALTLDSSEIVMIGVDQGLGDEAISSEGGIVSTLPGVRFRLTNLIDIKADGLTVITDGADLNLAGTISGEGGLIKQGTGDLILSAQNSFTGVSKIEQGRVIAATSDTLSASKSVIISQGAALELDADGPTSHVFKGLEGAGSVKGTNAEITLNGTGTYYFSGILESNRVLTKEGSGTQTLAGPILNVPHISVLEGTLALGNSNFNGTTTVVVEEQAKLDLSAASTTYIGTLYGEGKIALGSSTLRLANGQFDGQISGTGGLTKSTSGALILNGVNTYTGTTTLNGGNLYVGFGAANSSATLNSDVIVNARLGGTGTINGNVTVANGGMLYTDSFGGTFKVNGNVTMANGSLIYLTLDQPTGSANLSHGMTVNGDLALNGVSMMTAGGAFSEPGLYRLFNYTGSLTLNNGGLVGGVFNTIQNLTTEKQINLVYNTGTRVDLWNGNGLASATTNGGGDGVWSVANANWATADGNSGVRAPVNAYAIFSGAAGTVTVDTRNGAAPVRTVGMQIATDGYVLTGDKITLEPPSAGGPSRFNIGDGTTAGASVTATIENVIDGVSMYKFGHGTLVLKGANTFTENTRIDQGVLAISDEKNLGTLSAGVDINGGTLRYTGNEMNSERAITVSAAGGGIDVSKSSGVLTLFNFEQNGDLKKLGKGTLILADQSHLSGNTTISNGILQGTSDTLAGNIQNDAELRFVQEADGVFTGNITGAGSITKFAAGNLTLTGSNTSTGRTWIYGGNLTGNSDSLSGQIWANPDSSLIFEQSTDGTFNGGWWGAGEVIKRGSGALTMNGPVTVDSNFTIKVEDGTLIGNSNSLNGKIVNDATLVFNQTINSSTDATISGSGTVIKRGSGELSVFGNNTLTGDVRVEEGRLILRAANTLTQARVIDIAQNADLMLGTDSMQHTVQGVSGAGSIALFDNALDIAGNGNYRFDGTIYGGTGSAVSKSGTGALTLTSALDYQGNVYVNNGSLNLAADGSLDKALVAVARGATLDVSASANAALRNLQGEGLVNLGANTLTISDGWFAGELTGTGGIKKTSVNTLYLNGVNSYTGTTSVERGALMVGSSAAQSAAEIRSDVTVANGAALGGFGSIYGNVSVAQGGTLAPGDAGGTLKINGKLDMEQGSYVSMFIFDRVNDLDANHDVHVNGDLSLNGVTVQTNTNENIVPGLYKLFSYTGSLSLSNGGIAPNQPYYTIQNLTADKQINVIYAPDVRFDIWNGNGLASATQQGGGNGVWANANANWTDVQGRPALRSPDNAYTIFGGVAGTVTVDTAGGSSPVATPGMQFATDGYHLVGDTITLLPPDAGGPSRINVGDGSATAGSITATIDNVLDGTAIYKYGQGTLVLNGANTFTGTTRIDQGVLAVSSEANLGTLGAGVQLNGGTLRYTGADLTTSRQISLTEAGGGIDVAGASHTVTLSTSLTGPGILNKLGDGTLVLAAAAQHSGGTIISAGKLQASSVTLSGDVLNNGILQLDELNDGVFAGNISGSGTLIKNYESVLTLSGQNSYTGGTLLNAGGIQGDSRSVRGDYTLGQTASLLFTQDIDGQFNGKLSGSGNVEKTGIGLLALAGDSSSYDGVTRARAGTLQVNGKLGGKLFIDDGATLTGTGTVGHTDIATGATLAPGSASSSIGTLTVNGNLKFADGSSYQVQALANGTHDSVNVKGSASLAGSVLHLGDDGVYAASTTYTILTADAGVTGQFGQVSSDRAFLTPTLAYADNKVDLVVKLKEVASDNGGSRAIQFADAASSGNQRKAAAALQSLGANHALYSRILNLKNGEPAAVFESLSGASHASVGSALQGVASNVGSLAMNRLRSNLSAGMLPGQPTAQLGQGDASALPTSASQPVWAQVFGNWSTFDATSNAARSTQTDSGLMIGGDHQVGGGWRLGGALGYTDTRSRVRSQSSTANADSYSATIYGGKSFAAGAAKLNLSLGASYTWHDIKTQRNVNAAGVSQNLKSSYGASTSQFFTELGYAMPLNDRVTLEPFVGASYTDSRSRGFSESGGDAALRGMSSRNDVTATTLGLHAQTTFGEGANQGRLRGTVGWRHAFGDVTPTSTMAFDGSQTFTVSGTPIARDAAVLELGADVAVSKNTTVGVSYNGQFGNGNRQNAGSLDVRYRF